MLLVFYYLFTWIVIQWTVAPDQALQDLADLLREEDEDFNELQRIGLIPRRLEPLPANPRE
jgi:hypothetical protein